LKPRSNGSAASSRDTPTSTSQSGGGKANPFGAAKPREQVLQQRGVDIKSLDDKFEKKSKSTSSSAQQSWSPAQKAQVQAVRAELTRLEALWRDANEKELPEEVYRLQAQTKREELNQLLAAFK
jgi:hypothetical protein